MADYAPVRTLLALPLIAAAISVFSLQAQTPERPEFEVATIRLNTDCVNGAGHEQQSPGRFGVECVSLRDYIRGAYGSFGNGRNPNLRAPQVLGGPKWVDSDRYDVIAKAPADAGLDEMYGPMLRSLLEDRFQLKVHTEIQELPAYILSVAKGGVKLKAAKPESCFVIDLRHVLRSPPPPNFCGRTTTKVEGAKKIVDGFGISLTEFTDRIFRETLDRPVIDKTGLTGLFDIHLEYVRENAVSGPPRLTGTDDPVEAVPDTVGPSIFTAVQQQLGLKFSSDKGPVEVIVIDSVEKPSEN